jgi:hypothetical protein
MEVLSSTLLVQSSIIHIKGMGALYLQLKSISLDEESICKSLYRGHLIKLQWENAQKVLGSLFI